MSDISNQTFTPSPQKFDVLRVYSFYALVDNTKIFVFNQLYCE